MNILMGIKLIPSRIINKITLRYRKITVGKCLNILGILFVRGKGKIVIGDGVTINSCREANPIGGDSITVMYAKETGSIIIGNNVGISNSALVAMERIEIQDDVLIGGSCKIYDHDFHSLNYEERISFPDPGVRALPICIKKGAFIGAHSVILKGVTIGEKSIVGAGSVVTKNIPDGEIWGGNPARFLRKI